MNEIETDAINLKELIRDLVALTPRSNGKASNVVTDHEIYQKDFTAGFKDGKHNQPRKNGDSAGSHEGYNAGQAFRLESGFKPRYSGNGQHKKRKKRHYKGYKKDYARR
jgi:hypothetical protein